MFAPNAVNTILIRPNRMMNPKTNDRYRKFGTYLKEKFGTKVYKITLDADFSCPNRDGTLSTRGCIFCDESGSFSNAHSSLLSIKEQVQTAINNLPKRFHAQKFLAYFQAYSNTYGPLGRLKEVYDDAFSDERVVGISIGTRPDCVNEEKIKLISTYKNPWIEFGLQSIHNKTLKLINRGHDFECFLGAYELSKQYGIKVCAHVILGLPGETEDDMLETAKTLAKLRIDGVKFHVLTVLKNTPLYYMHKSAPLNLLTEDEYCNILCDFLEILPKETTIQRTAGTGLVSELVAPLWVKNKFETQNKIERFLRERNSYQGIKFTP